jgi:ribonuclease Z
MPNISLIGCIFLVLTAFSSAAHAQTSVILLGTGTPFPDPNAAGPATAVIVGKRVFLFDAGANVMRQINAAGLPITGP